MNTALSEERITEVLRTRGPKSGSSGYNWQHILLLLLVTWFLFTQAYHGAINPDSPITGWDFQVFYKAAQRLINGESLYTISGSGEGSTPYLYSPLLATLLRPLAHLSLQNAVKTWFFISTLCLLLSVVVYALAVSLSLSESVAISILLIVSFRFWPMVFNFALGQSNNLLLLSACAMFWADSRRKSRLAAFLIALAALIKPWMIGMLIYPMIQRKWRTVAWTIAFYCVSLLLLFLPLGWKEWLNYCHVTAANATQSFLVSQSILGFARLHFMANPHVQTLVNSPLACYGFVIVAYSIIGGGFLYLFSRKTPASAYESRLWFGLSLLSLPLVSPLCHDEYYILALPLLWALLTFPRGDAQGIHCRIAAAGALLIYVLLTRSWPTSGEGLAAHQHGLGSLLVTAFFIFGALLWLVGFYAVIRARRADGRTSTSMVGRGHRAA